MLNQMFSLSAARHLPVSLNLRLFCSEAIVPSCRSWLCFCSRYSYEYGFHILTSFNIFRYTLLLLISSQPHDFAGLLCDSNCVAQEGKRLVCCSPSALAHAGRWSRKKCIYLSSRKEARTCTPYTKNVLMDFLLVMGHMRYPGRLTEACLDGKERQTSR